MAEVLNNRNLFSSSSSSCGSTHLFSTSVSHKSSSSSSSSSLRFQPVKSSFKSGFHGNKVVLRQFQKEPRRGNLQVVSAQMTLRIGKAQKWWEKGHQENMKEITSAEDFVESLLNAGDKLVIVDFFSPGCGGCRALHPKICQIAEMNPDVQFLQVNYEEHKSMCYSLNVHVLPFFRFYRGAHGRLCSFSCTNATIKKFRDALAKHTTDRCSLGPTKGLEESELLALAANKELSFTYTPYPESQPAQEEEVSEPLPETTDVPNVPVPSFSRATMDSEDKTLLTAGR